MTSRLDEQLSRYGTYLDSLLVEVEPEYSIDRVTSQSHQALPVVVAVPTWRRGLVVAVGTAATLLVLIGAIILLARPFGSEEPAPPVTEPPEVVTTVPNVQPGELVPTGAHLLTEPSAYLFGVRDPSGLVWASDYEGHVARLDPVTGETQVWTQRDDATFGPGVVGLAPARGGGVWMVLGDGSLRWFDGVRFREVVDGLPLVSDRDSPAAVVETADGSLLASTSEGGLFRWDGSSWSHIDGAGPAAGAGALAVDAEGTLWAGNDDVGGISHYDGEHWTAYTSDDAKVLAGPVRTIDPLSDGTVWVNTETGVARFDGATWSEWTAAEIGLRGVISATVGPDGTVWAAAGAEAHGSVGVASFNGEVWSVYGAESGLPEETSWIIATPIATEHGVFVATGAGIYQLVGDRWTRVLPLEEPAVREEPPASFAGVRGMEISGGFLWVWGENEIWRYTDGTWEEYAPTSSAPSDVAYDGDTLWALTEGLSYLDGNEWRQLAVAPYGVWRIDADPNTGILWLSTGGELFRWGSEEMANVGFPPNYPPQSDGASTGFVGDIVVAADGSVWATGLNGYLSWLGGLAVYHDDSSSWETVRPWRSDEDIPASSLAPTPDGDLWVMLSDWSEDWEEPTAPPPRWALAHRDGATGDWTIYDEALPDGYPLVMGATDDAVWLAQGDSSAEGFQPIEGAVRFNGETWTHHVTGAPVDIAVAPDGTIWYTTSGGVLRQLEP
jgi:streptogramin lyase